jgi:CDP-glucose 4,6-dehydratase
MAERESALENLGMIGLFSGAYAGRRVLVTGHTGFKGSWLVYWLRSMRANVAGFALAPDTEPAHWHLLALTGVADLRGDLREPEVVLRVLQDFKPEIVFHLAAQPLVRRSYREPAVTFASNVQGLVHLLEAVRASPSVRAVVNATTDKVYADHQSDTGYRENDELGGYDPYSASKACAELVSDCYRKSFFQRDDGRGFPVRLATVRSGNVIGGGDWACDRLVPDLVRASEQGGPLRVRHPDAVRPWQHVLEPLSGYLRLGQALLAGEAAEYSFNFGPERSSEISVADLVTRLQSNWLPLRVEPEGQAQLHEAGILRLDWERARQTLAWRPVWDIGTALARTAQWYRAQREAGQLRTGDDLRTYIADARRAGLEWAT